MMLSRMRFNIVLDNKMYEVFRGGVSGLIVTLSSKTIETLSSETNTFAIVVPSEFFVIGIDTACFFVSTVRSDAFAKLDCLSIESNTDIFL